MGKIEYLNSLVYPLEELHVGSKTLRRNLMEDNSCQILINDDRFIKSRLSYSFSNRISIENGSDANLLGSDN
ncbi:hypothetical protein GW17_00050857 [Ensete ventricosum]|nr:hypothetical protein GW17_00050857 [Ensete ventricosum]